MENKNEATLKYDLARMAWLRSILAYDNAKGLFSLAHSPVEFAAALVAEDAADQARADALAAKNAARATVKIDITASAGLADAATYNCPYCGRHLIVGWSHIRAEDTEIVVCGCGREITIQLIDRS